MASKSVAAQRSPTSGGEMGHGEREVPLQVMVPVAIRRQVALMGAGRGENIRTVVLRGLRAIGIDVPESELADRRGRRRNGKVGSDGTQ
jgi:hypothetical protein